MTSLTFAWFPQLPLSQALAWEKLRQAKVCAQGGAGQGSAHSTCRTGQRPRQAHFWLCSRFCPWQMGGWLDLE